MASRKCDSALCDKTAESTTLKPCSRCRKAAYCSRDCQAAAWPTHKASCRRPNYIVKVHLFPGDITDPDVVRTLSCPANADFYQLHLALQVAFGWASCHMFDFAVKDPSYREPEGMVEVFQRTMAMHDAGSIMPAMQGREYILRLLDPSKAGHADRMHEGLRRHVNTTERSAVKYKLYQLFDASQFQGHEILYVYDYGDNWEHYLTVTGRADATDDFVCLGGSGHGVAEDVGSIRGWAELKKCYATAHPNTEQRERRRWYEKQAANGDPRGLSGDRVNFWDRDLVNRNLVGVSKKESDW